MPVKAGVPFVDLAGQHEPLREELSAVFERVIAGSSFILGEEVESFEREFAEYCGVKHCVGIASGTAALTVAMKAAGIEPADEVIVPAHTFIASALAVLHAGAQPVLCDVNEETGLIDLDSAETVVTPRTAAIMPVHLYGQACDMGAVTRFASKHDLAVLEDAAQAHGAEFGGRRIGSMGTAAAFSFYPSKNLGALGDAGAVTTDDDDLADRARALRDLGRRGRQEHELAGFNERLDGLQAGVLRVKLPHLDRWIEGRREAAGTYRSELDAPVRVLPERDGTRCAYHLFPIRVPDRDALAARLEEAGIETGLHYSPALHGQPPLLDAARPVDGCPVAEGWARDELSLPMWEGLRPETAARVAAVCTASM
jgi:dTDP-4-amino-4,6-dideoxygalactose transaminase